MADRFVQDGSCLGWSSQEFRSEFENLLSDVSTERPHATQTQALRVICRILVDRFETLNNRDIIFTRFFQKIDTIFDHALNILKNMDKSKLGDVGDHLYSSLRHLVEILESQVPLVQHLTSLNECPLEMVGQMPTFLLNILYNSYNHCISSEDIYRDSFESVADQMIKSLYHTSCQLMTYALRLLEKMGLCDECIVVDEVASISRKLSDIGQILQNVDLRLMVEIWKAYTKMITQNGEALKRKLDVAPAIRHLCKEVKARTLELLQLLQQDANVERDKETKKALKLCGFNMKLVVTFCDKFSGFLGDCIRDATELLIFLSQLSSPVLIHPLEEIHSCLTVGIEPLATALLGERQFSTCLIAAGQNSPYALVLLLVTVMDKLPGRDEDTYESWMHCESSIFVATFDAFCRCKVESMLPPHLPSVMCNGKPRRDVTLHEYVCTHLCAFVASLPAKYLPRLERLLLTRVLSSDWSSACLSSDVWCFLARFSPTSDLCFSHCCVLSKILESLNSCATPASLHLEALLRRLVAFLSPNHLAELHKKFSSTAKNILGCSEVTGYFPGAKLDRDACCKLFDQVTGFLVWMKNNPKHYPSEETMECLSYLCLSLPDICRLDSDLGKTFIVRSFRALGILLSNLTDNGETLVLILRLLSEESLSSHELRQVAFLSFAEPLTSSLLPMESLGLLASNFGLSLSQDDRHVLRHASLRLFATFARKTPRSELIPTVFRFCTLARQEITDHLKGQIAKGPIKKAADIELFRKMASTKTRDIEEMPAKRRKTNRVEAARDAFLEHLANLEKAIDKLQELCRVHSTTNVPAIGHRIENCAIRLQKLCHPE